MENIWKIVKISGVINKRSTSIKKLKGEEEKDSYILIQIQENFFYGGEEFKFGQHFTCMEYTAPAKIAKGAILIGIDKKGRLVVQTHDNLIYIMHTDFNCIKTTDIRAPQNIKFLEISPKKKTKKELEGATKEEKCSHMFYELNDITTDMTAIKSNLLKEVKDTYGRKEEEKEENPKKKAKKE